MLLRLYGARNELGASGVKALISFSCTHQEAARGAGLISICTFVLVKQVNQLYTTGSSEGDGADTGGDAHMRGSPLLRALSRFTNLTRAGDNGKILALWLHTGTPFTCFTGRKVRILTRSGCTQVLNYLLY